MLRAHHARLVQGSGLGMQGGSRAWEMWGAASNPLTARSVHSARWSGEVDVASEAGLAGTVEQPKRRDTLFSAGAPPDYNDHARVWQGCRQMREVVPVAGEKYAASLVGEAENFLVGGIAGKAFTQQRNVVAELLQQIAKVPNSCDGGRHYREGTSL